MFMLTNRGERFSDIFVREGNKLLLLLLIKPISLETKCLGFFFCLHVYIYSGHLLCIRVVNRTRYERQKGQLNLTFQSKDVHVKTIQLCKKKNSMIIFHFTV